MNILLTLAYNGAAYHGFQVQANARTICFEVQNALEMVLGERPDVKGSSRTDAGVHARAFMLNFHSDTAIPMEKLPLALNTVLPEDIRVLAARPVPVHFHARYTAKGKEYEYIILNRAVDDPFAPGQYYRVNGELDVDAMNAAAAHLTGTHDFSAFMSAGSDIEDTTRTVAALSARRSGPWVTITISADGFLYNMVRIIAGTLLLVGQGKQQPAWAAEVLAGKNRQHAGPTLPARGLFLNRVFYTREDLGLPE